MSTPRVKPGDVLGAKYRVERILGVGGMGIVVAAMHIELGQRVALKFMLKEAMDDPSHAERFLREAKSAVQLKSNHTARVLDVGRLKNGEPYMVMEYLEGRDLDAELQARGPLPPLVAIDYMLQAGEALAEAHGLGMIHRDIKLKNLFLTTTVDGRPLVKVLDFGLAKTLGLHGDAALTATNAVFGSPQYMSPEQMRAAKDVDTRSDIWAFGVCLYELLTGRLPFDAQGIAEICAMVLKDPVPPPSQFLPGLPADLEAVILKCLEKDVARRFQSIADLAVALQGYAPDESSARRILKVMQTAQKVEHPTIASAGLALGSEQGVGKTLNAWDSGSPTRRTAALLTRPQLIAAFAGVMLLGIVGAGASAVAIKKRAAQAQPTTTDAASDPPPATVPLGTVIGASPDPPLPPSDVTAEPLPDPAENTTPSTTAPAATARKVGGPSARPPLSNKTATPPASAKPPKPFGTAGERM